MNNYGFMKVAAAVPFTKIADPFKNAEKIIDASVKAAHKTASIVVFPELSQPIALDQWQYHYLDSSQHRSLLD